MAGSKRKPMPHASAGPPRKRAKRSGELAHAPATPGVHEQGQGLTQIVLDSMSEGVALFDGELRLRFINRQLAEFQNYPPAIVRIGIPLADLIRFQVERGDF